MAADFVFPNPLDPWATPFPEIVSLVNVQEDMIEIDFVGVKIGDLNGTAMSNFQSPQESYLRETIYLSVEDRELEKGMTYTIPIKANDLAELGGLQGTFQWHDLEVVDIRYDLAPAFGQDNLGFRHLKEGYLTMVWAKPAEMFSHHQPAQETSLFSLVVRAKKNAKLSELLSINSRYTAAEAYTTALTDISPERGGQVFDLGLVFGGTDAAQQRFFDLYQNTPNPFAVATLIGFSLPEDATATVTINDASGRVLTIIKGDYAAGYNTINVTKQMIQGATGVLSYTIKAGDHRATKQMIVVD
ncbi:T9SS type A sorting domain-containing protein [Lewinella sp. LCG006]|uniref:T9SS type A sorting domain-containing protein n=1 Tax=Lewinella sp. LCG006 TaxID=3231911 RepID=UPI0034608235